MKKLLKGIAGIGLAVAIFGCGTVENKSTNAITTDKGKNYATIKGNETLFKSEPGSLTINNQASFDVIIFAGKVANNNVMGAISAQKNRSFDLAKLNLPGKKGSFLIRAAAFEKYSGKYQVKESDILYTGLVVYDLTDPKDKTNINIYAGIQETEQDFIYVSNMSKFVLELRLDTPTGEKIATLPPLQENKRIFLTPLPQGMPYSFYPTYVYVDPSTNEIQSFISSGVESRERRIPTSENRVNPMVFRGPKDTSAIGYLVAFVRVKNDTRLGFNLNDGTTWLADQKGRRLVESGDFSTFELPAASGSAGQLYTGLNMEFDNGAPLKIRSMSLKPGVVYDVTVSDMDGKNFGYDIRETARKDKLEDMRMSLFLGD
jgi:hypothetical protein